MENKRTPLLLFVVACMMNGHAYAQAPLSDREQLSVLNEKFIRNFVTSDTVSHNEIIHADFVCIYSNGRIVYRKEYMAAWAHAFTDRGYRSFKYVDEAIRIFGDLALVRSKNTFTYLADGKLLSGETVYTDTYIKENGRWWCVQAQITPVKQ